MIRGHAFVRLSVFGLAVAAVMACDDDGSTGPTTETFRASLNGANERPTPRTTTAQGTANFTLRRDTLAWTVALTNITNVTAAHIHIGGANDAGGILLGMTPGTSGVNNTLLAGFVTRATYVAPNAPNAAVTFDSLLVLMRNGGAYVNVHTDDPLTNPSNTGAGDFPGGEIRGQLARVP